MMVNTLLKGIRDVNNTNARSEESPRRQSWTWVCSAQQGSVQLNLQFSTHGFWQKPQNQQHSKAPSINPWKQSCMSC
jgi:hypothetical protein